MHKNIHIRLFMVAWFIMAKPGTSPDVQQKRMEKETVVS